MNIKPFRIFVQRLT